MSGTSEKRILKQRGLLSVVFGVLFLLAAIYITGSNLYEDQQAGIASSRIMKQLQIREEKLHAPNDLPKISGSIPSEEKETEMLLDEVDGVRYLGYLTIPDLDLILPVAYDWDFDQLKQSPARYTGSYLENDLVICAHNSRAHFRKLLQMPIGKNVYLTSPDGSVYKYVVSSIEDLSADETVRMTGESISEKGWDLTLFTCTLDALSRHAVRCIRTD